MYNEQINWSPRKILPKNLSMRPVDCRGAHENVVLEGFSGVINWTKVEVVIISGPCRFLIFTDNCGFFTETSIFLSYKNGFLRIF